MTDAPSAAPASFTPADFEVELPRVEFDDHGVIEGEPSTDVRIETAGGTILRERIVEIASSTPLPPPGTKPVAPAARTLSITNALLTTDGAVALDLEGRPLVSSRHEVVLTNEAMGRLGSPGELERAIQDARQSAAAMAEMEFKGMSLFDEVIAGRTRASSKPEGEVE